MCYNYFINLYCVCMNSVMTIKINKTMKILVIFGVMILALVASQEFNKTIFENTKASLTERVYFRGMRRRGEVFF